MPAAPPRPLRWLPATLFALLAIGLTGGWYYATAATRTHARGQDLLIAEQTALRVSDWVNTRLAFLRSLRSLAEAGLYDSEGTWAARISHLVDQVGGFQAINWIDARGVITRIAPIVGNEPALGRRVLDHPVVGKTLADAMGRVELRVSPPLDLYQGGRGFTAYVPVRAGGRPDAPLLGVVNGVFRTDHLAEACLSQLAPTHAARLTDADALVTQTATALQSHSTKSHATLSVADRTWTLTLEPRAGTAAVDFSLGWLAIGLALAGGLAWLLRVALARQAEVSHALAERAEMESRLRAAERLEAMGHLAGGVAHDFNNLLTVIQGRADLLAELVDEASSDRADLLENVDGIRDAARRAAGVTAQLLAFARREPISHGCVDLAAHVRAVAPMLRNLATEAVAVELDLDRELPPQWIACPAGVVDRVLVNLVANAREATPQGGHIRIGVRSTPPWVTLTVADDGRGMPPEVLARAFEPFYTTRSGGSGLGLATVYGLVTQRGGAIDATSTPGLGTRFTLRFPAAPPPADLPSRLAPAPTRARPNALRVAVIEDHAPVRAVVVRALRAAGFAVLDFPDAESALAAAPDADVLVTDLVLPGLDGVQASQRLRERLPRLAVIIVSGYSDRPGAVDDSLAGGARFLAKPFQMADLVELVREVSRPAAEARPPATDDRQTTP